MIWTSNQQTTINCPLHNDTKPSFSYFYDTSKNELKWTCYSGCGSGYTAEFVKRFFNDNSITKQQAEQLFSFISSSNFVIEKGLKNYDDSNLLIKQLNSKYFINSSLLKKYFVGITQDYKLQIPIFKKEYLFDVRTYDPNSKTGTKLLGRKGGKTGIFFPEISPNKTLIIVEGEKDALVGRALGLNSIVSITGGALRKPIFTEQLKDKNVFLLFDNDAAGIKGQEDLYQYLKKHDINVQCVNPFYKKGQDLADYVESFNEFEKEQIVDRFKNDFKKSGTYSPKVKKTIRVNIQDIKRATDLTQFLNKKISITAFINTKTTSLKALPQSYILLDIMGNVIKEVLTEELVPHIKSLLTNKKSLVSLFKEYFEPQTRQVIPSLEIQNWFIGTMVMGDFDITIFSNKNFDINTAYKITAIPFLDNATKSICLFASGFNQKEVLDFRLNTNFLDEINKYSYEDIINKVIGLTKINYNPRIVETLMLTYASALEAIHPQFGSIPMNILSFVLTDTGFGKSLIASRIQQSLDLGKKVSLVGAAATPQGLLGGTADINGMRFTKAGVVPRLNKQLVIFEELSKNKNDFFNELTEIITSREVNITRVASHLKIPCWLRMAFFANPKSKKGYVKTVAQYKNGLIPIQELVITPENVGRIDLITLLGSRDECSFDKLSDPFPNEVLRHLILWIWTRSKEQIIFYSGYFDLLKEISKDLNALLSTNSQLFGRKTFIKVMKISIAVASLCASHQNYINIFVKEEHLNKAKQIILKNYHNTTFNLAEYALEDAKKTKVTPEDIKFLEEFMEVNEHTKSLVNLLSDTSNYYNFNELDVLSGYNDKDILIPDLNKLAKRYFIYPFRGRYTSTTKLQIVLKEFKK